MENYEGHALTAVSLHHTLPQPPERRGEERQTTLLRVGKLLVEGEQRLCVIRNISSAGAMIKLYQPIDEGARIEIEPTPDCPAEATVLWVRDDLAGVAFTDPVDVIAVLKGEGRAGPYRRVARTPRLSVRRPARLCTEDAEFEVLLCDLSLNGAKIVTEQVLVEDSEIALFIDGLPALPGRVRWCHDAMAGMEFDIPIAMDMLAAWIGLDAGSSH